MDDLMTIFRWIFLSTWVGIMLALLAGLWMMIRINLKLDQDRADRELTRHMLSTAIRTAAQIAPEIRPNHDVKPADETSMGMDFGATAVWQWFRRVWDRRSGQERRLGA